jgi:hypothetical protein
MGMKPNRVITSGPEDGLNIPITPTMTQMAASVIVTIGGPIDVAAPNTDRSRGRVARSWATQSTHWTPTAAPTWHSGHTGRPHRWQRTNAARSG